LEDIRHYGDAELSGRFENDESLYVDLIRAARREDFQSVKVIADLFFIYTPTQLDDLRETFEEEVEEFNGD
jgi:hypothetical protein